MLFFVNFENLSCNFFVTFAIFTIFIYFSAIFYLFWMKIFAKFSKNSGLHDNSLRLVQTGSTGLNQLSRGISLSPLPWLRHHFWTPLFGPSPSTMFQTSLSHSPHILTTPQHYPVLQLPFQATPLLSVLLRFSPFPVSVHLFSVSVRPVSWTFSPLWLHIITIYRLLHFSHISVQLHTPPV